MRKLLRLLSMIGAWATDKLVARGRAERALLALPVSTLVRLTCRCSGMNHGGIWRVESYNPEYDDYRLTNELTGQTTIARRDVVEVYNPTESS